MELDVVRCNAGLRLGMLQIEKANADDRGLADERLR